jgi:hypothetical protein
VRCAGSIPSGKYFGTKIGSSSGHFARKRSFINWFLRRRKAEWAPSQFDSMDGSFAIRSDLHKIGRTLVQRIASNEAKGLTRALGQVQML